MSRPINALTAELLSNAIVRPVVLIELNLESTVLRLTSATRDIPWNGHSFLANGWVLPPDGITESTDVGNYSFKLTLSGVNLAVISAVLDNPDRGELGTIWLAMLNESAEIVGAPIVLYRGMIDSCEIEDKFETPLVIVNLETDLARFDTSQNFRFTAQSQAAYFPGDVGFQYVTQLENWSGFWGKPERPKWLTRQKSTKRK
jgi:hypothetical protein